MGINYYINIDLLKEIESVGVYKFKCPNGFSILLRELGALVDFGLINEKDVSKGFWVFSSMEYEYTITHKGLEYIKESESELEYDFMDAESAREITKEKSDILDSIHEINNKISIKNREISSLEFDRKKLNDEYRKLVRLDNISVSDQFKDIIDNIKRTAKKGINTYYYEGLLHNENKLKLINLGYEVKHIEKVKTDITIISWL